MDEMLPCYKHDIDVLKDELDIISNDLLLVWEALEKSGEQTQMFIGRQLGLIYDRVDTAQDDLRSLLHNANNNREQYDIVEVRHLRAKKGVNK